MGACPMSIDCEVGEWTEGECSATCGEGTAEWIRHVIRTPEGGGQPCPSPMTKLEACNQSPCGVDCVWAEWHRGMCSVSCGSGTITSSRTHRIQAAYGGKACVGEDTRQEVCSLDPCPVDCGLSEWVDSPCSSSCGPGVLTSIRTIVRKPQNDGKACPAQAELTSTTPCNLKHCPVNCRMSDWEQGVCSKSCGGGLRSSRRSVIQEGQHQGVSCPTDLARTEECNTHPCPIDCVLGPWKAGSCSTSCDVGVVVSVREIVTPESNGGMPCPKELRREDSCFLTSCAVDCVVSLWSQSPCSVSCGKGLVTETRQVLSRAEAGGMPCGPLSRSFECVLQPCDEPRHCRLSDWVITRGCSAECGDGVVTMTRMVIAPPEHGGAACPPANELERSAVCNLRACVPVDCVLGDWASDGCSSPCGPGMHTRRRPILTVGAHGGVRCPPPDELVETVPCQIKTCDGTGLHTLAARIRDLELQNEALLSRQKQLLASQPALAARIFQFNQARAANAEEVDRETEQQVQEERALLKAEDERVKERRLENQIKTAQKPARSVILHVPGPR